MVASLNTGKDVNLVLQYLTAFSPPQQLGSRSDATLAPLEMQFGDREDGDSVSGSSGDTAVIPCVNGDRQTEKLENGGAMEVCKESWRSSSTSSKELRPNREDRERPVLIQAFAVKFR